MGYNEDFKKVMLSEPHCILGKKGITTEFIRHVSNLLKRYKIIKIKALKTIANKLNIKELANKIVESTDSYLIDIRGKMIIISINKIKKKP